jgi:regulator of PEP synthase PpsR (kinase-PPPase family)
MERVRTMGVQGSSDYSDLGRIKEELSYARRIYKELGADVVDVTDRAVEETAAMVMEMVNNRRGHTI